MISSNGYNSVEARRWPGTVRILRRFWPHLRRELPSSVMIAVLMTLAIPPAIAAPFLVKHMIDTVIPQHDVSRLLQLAVLTVGLALIAGLLGFAHQALSIRLHNRVTFDLTRDLFSHVLRLPIGFFNRTETGYLMARVVDDIGEVTGVMLDRFAKVLLDVLKAAIILALLMMLDPVLASLGAVLFSFVLGLALLLSPALRQRGMQAHEVTAHTNSALHQSLSGITLIRTTAQERREGQRFGTATKEKLDAYARRDTLIAGISYASNALSTAGAYAIIAVGAYRISMGYSSFGNLIAFFTLLLQLIGTSNTLFDVVPSAQSALAALQRIFALKDEDVESDSVADAPAHEPLRGRVVFRDVAFRYDRGQHTLQGINMEIQPGEMVALVGRSGAGKSTLAQLVPRLYDPTDGLILLDGRPLASYPLRWLRDRIGVVQQDTFLFDRSIRDNVAYACPDASDEAIKEACRVAHADFILEAVNGYGTLVGENGIRLSGGQKQRLAIAREILRDPPILILDEATSSLDSESEALVRDAMERLMKGRTCLIIAHRLSTVRRADRILVMDSGKIVEQGTHEELVTRSTLYRELYQTQFRDSAPAMEGMDGQVR